MGAGSRTGLAGAAAVTISSCTDFTGLAGACTTGKLSAAVMGVLAGAIAAGCSLTGAVAICGCGGTLNSGTAVGCTAAGHVGGNHQTTGGRTGTVAILGTPGITGIAI